VRRWRHPPLWLRYLLSLTVAGGALIGLVSAVHSSNGGSPAPENPAAALQANRESQIVVTQDQAPHSAPLPRGSRPRLALERSIAVDARERIRHQEITGPFESIRCARGGPRRAAREAFRCTVVAGNLSYPFLGVVDLRAGTVTWCKRDPPPTPALDVAVSRRCRT